jgi:hypothetical protein
MPFDKKYLQIIKKIVGINIYPRTVVWVGGTIVGKFS